MLNHATEFLFATLFAGIGNLFTSQTLQAHRIYKKKPAFKPETATVQRIRRRRT